MTTPPQLVRTALALAASATLALGSVAVRDAQAATVQWAGLGTSAAWSDALNWVPQRPPADGDDLLFGGATPRTSGVFDLVRSFSSLTFNGDSPLFVTHVLGSGAQLAFSGVGIRAFDTLGTAIGRQTFFADAGSTGGTILFTHSAGINVGSGQFARAVDVTAQGGATTGAIGGRIVFQDSAATSGSTFDVLRAVGASVAGASGGEIIVRDTALVTRLTSVVVDGGTSVSATGGRASFQGQAQNTGGVSIQAGQAGGRGGRADISGNAVFLGTSSLYAEGGAAALAGSEATAGFRGDARFMGSAYLGAGRVAGANGGRIDFFDRASHDTTSFDSGSGRLGIFNVGAVESGAGGGALVFHDDSAIRGAHLFIVNQTAEFMAPGALAGSTSFLDRSRAGQVAIDNAGSGGAGGPGGATDFRNLAHAENATIVSFGGVANGAAGGSTLFADSASAGSASLHNAGGSAAGALGGTLALRDTARAGTATIVNAPGQVAGASGGVTTFTQDAGAGSAFISNQASLSAEGGGRGTAFFKDASSAQHATIDNQGGTQLINAFTVFSQAATAGNASITNFGGSAVGAGGGLTQFLDRSTAGAATLVMAGGGVHGALGGATVFFTDTTAGDATLGVRGATVVGAEGGRLRFVDRATAGRSTVTVQGAQASGIGGPEGGVVSFAFNASAAQSTVSIDGNRYAFSSPGRVQFNDAATAADASFTTLAGFNAGGRLSFTGTAFHTASAGRASISNGSRLPGSVSTGDDFGGATLFLAHSSADRATIHNAAGATAFGAQTVFRADSTAASAVIVNAGGRAGDRGGITFFQDAASAGRADISNRAGAMNASGMTQFDGTASAAQSTLTAGGASAAGDVGGRVLFTGLATAAQSTLIADGGSAGGSAGGLGGRIEFSGQASAGTARVVLNAGSAAAAAGTLDIGRIDVSLPVGSIEGGGNINLGAKSLFVVGNGRAGTFAGVISGTVPPVFPSLAVLGGTLTLSGANTYAGRTQVGDGLNANSGKLVVANTAGSATGSGEVRIERGGTLSGSGTLAGPVALRDGGTIAPGDPVTLTLQDTLTWDGGGVIRLVLGADDASSDHLVVHSLARGTDGHCIFDLIDTGIVAGTAYTLIHFDSSTGFNAGDFTSFGSATPGHFSVTDDAIGFTAAAVPEPGTTALLSLGLLGLIWRARRVSASVTQTSPCRVGAPSNVGGCTAMQCLCTLARGGVGAQAANSSGCSRSDCSRSRSRVTTP